MIARQPDSPPHHDLKCWVAHFEPVWRGDKTHEVRRDDRGFAVGDTVRLREWAPDRAAYTGRSVRAVITYVSRPGALGSNIWLPEGMVVFSFRVIARAEDL